MAGPIINPNVDVPAPIPPATPRPQRPHMWVTWAISFAIILGFFWMLGYLLHEQFNPKNVIACVPSTAPTPTPTLTPTPTPPVQGNARKGATGPSPTPTPTPTPTPPVQSNANPGGLQNVLFTLLGALGAAFTQVVNFWLGSSKGSSDKTDLLASQRPAQS